ncbi:TlyA family RNA methyltransferase [Atopobium fossor]|uniref:TlyA family RNA methyltransferase n=1 Tax=Atopobium fossor TaxID=39487 RepID=UPI0003FAB045|nr:TlyA family RNA methyltransferase [Atopobium fossor]
MARVRLDVELVNQGFFATTSDAMRAVMAGDVFTTNRKLTSAGEQVKPGIELHVRGGNVYVSRGGIKLERGLTAFKVDPAGCACVDVGCSTGGFTDCLLRHGAASVLSVDVGYAQFDWSLRNDKRVTLLERTNIVDVATPERVGTIDLAVCDVSFTSVRAVAGAVWDLLREDGTFLTLVKPQFETARNQVEEGGVVRSPTVWLECLETVSQDLLHKGFAVLDVCASPIVGHKGNHEFLLLASKGEQRSSVDFSKAIAQITTS